MKLSDVIEHQELFIALGFNWLFTFIIDSPARSLVAFFAHLISLHRFDLCTCRI